MGFYDHFFYKDVSAPGLWVVQTQTKKIFSYLKTYIPTKKIKLLEIGVGKGYFAKICNENSIDYYGIEPNVKQAEKLKKEGFNITSCMTPPVPFENNQFDTIYCSHILEHMDTYQMAQNLIADIFNKLKEDGHIVIVSPNFIDWQKDFYDDCTHNYVTTLRRVVQLLSNNGFEIVFTTLFNGFLFGKKRLIFKYLNRIYPWKLLDALFGKYVHKDFFWKAKPTFNENIFIIAKKVKPVS